MYNWLDNIIQIIPANDICAVYTDRIGRLEWIPAAGTALYRSEAGGMDLQLFIFDRDGVAGAPEDDVNFVGWFSGGNRPTEDDVDEAVERLRNHID